MNRGEFDEWVSTFIDTIVDWQYYVDFSKIYEHMSDLMLRANLNLLSTLIGSSTIRADFIELYNRYPDILKVIPIILAIRLEATGRGKNKRYQLTPIREYHQEDLVAYDFDFYQPNYPINDYADFLEKTGVFDLLSSHLTSNLQDYVYGVEVGLDSNGRKNRTGKIMESLVESEIKKAGFIKGENYYSQISSKVIQEKWGIDLSSITNGGKNNKKFDFAICYNEQIYLIEVNFYSKSGSKPNETARSYINLAEKIDSLPNVTFIWITDGAGWLKSIPNLEEVFDKLPTLYNLHDIRNHNLKELLGD